MPTLINYKGVKYMEGKKVGKRWTTKSINGIVRAVLSVIVCMTVCLSGVCQAGAWVSRQEGMSDEEMLKHVECWTQWGDPWAGEPLDGSSNDTVAESGCSTYSFAYMLVKMGLLDPKKGDSAKTLIDKARKCTTYMWNGCGVEYYFNYPECSALYPDISYERCEEYCDVPIADALKVAKKKMSEGYYCIMQLNGGGRIGGGHMVFIDGFTDDGKTSIGDSGYGEGTTLEDIYDMSTLNSWYLELFSYKVPSNQQPSIYDDTAIRTGESAYTKEDEALYQDLINEWNLEGMPEKSKLRDSMVLPDIFRLSDSKGLTLENKIQIKGILESKEAQYPTPVQVAGVVMAVLGIICFVYALLLTLGYFIDRFNTIIDVSVVGVLTLGHIRLLTREEKDLMEKEDVKKKGYSTSVKLFIIVGVLCLVGGLMVSQVLPRLVYRLIHTVIS